MLGTLGLLATPGTARAQGVRIGTAGTPDAKAALDISASDKGLLIPRLDSVQRVALGTPPDGLMVFQKNGRVGLWYAFGGSWFFIPDNVKAHDNLGSHTATQNLNLNGFQLTGGGSDGVQVASDGRVGIGALRTGYPLTIKGRGTNSDLLTFQNAGGVNKWHWNLLADGVNLVESGVADRLYVQPGGNVGIGNTAPAQLLQLGSSSYARPAFLRLGAGNGTAQRQWELGVTVNTANLSDVTGENYDFAIRDATANATRLLIDYATGRVGIGTGNPAATLHVGGGASTVRLDGLAGTGSRILVADATGTLSATQAVPGANNEFWSTTGNAGLTGTRFLGTTDTQPLLFRTNNTWAGQLNFTTGNTAYGVLSQNATATGLYNTAYGYHSMSRLTTGTDNLGIGPNALFQITTPNDNTAVGSNTMFETVTGARNTAVGRSAMYKNRSGSFNVAVGRQALFSDTTSNGNTAVGAQALILHIGGDDNTALGNNAAKSLASGTLNVGLGSNALDGVVGGNGNTAVGAGATGSGTTTGLTLVGASATAAANLTNATALGYHAAVTQSNTMVLGGTGAYAANVGVGTTTPQQKLDVAGTVQAQDFRYATTQTRYLSVAAEAFSASISSYHADHLIVFPGGTYFPIATALTGGTAGQAGYLTAPVNLPQGATITSLELTAIDNDGTGVVPAVTLAGVSPAATGASANPSLTVLATLSAEGPNWQTVTAPANHVVNNALNSYKLTVRLNQNSGGTLLFGVRIGYTITQPE